MFTKELESIRQNPFCILHSTFCTSPKQDPAGVVCSGGASNLTALLRCFRAAFPSLGGLPLCPFAFYGASRMEPISISLGRHYLQQAVLLFHSGPKLSGIKVFGLAHFLA